MTRISSGQSAPVSNLQNAIKTSMADKNLDKTELAQLKQLVQNTPGLSDETKAGVTQFLEEAHSDSKGFFFGLFGKGISNHEMGALKDLAQSQGNNPVLSGLVDSLEQQQPQTPTPGTARREPQQSANNVRSRPSASFNPLANIFSNSRPSFQGLRGASTSADFSDFYVTQNGNSLPSSTADCGPACAAMVAKRFGFIDDSVSNRNAVQTARRASGVTSARDGAWAISESEVAKSIQNMTGGKVRQTAHETFNSGQISDFTSTLQSQLSHGAMPVIEIGSPYNSGGGRHYMVAMEVKPNGNIVVADPGGRGQWEMTPDQLATEMRQADTRGGSHILSFNR